MINNSSNLGKYRNQINSLETNLNNTSTTLTNKINTTIANELTPIKNRLNTVETEITPIARGGTGANNAENALKNLNIQLSLGQTGASDSYTIFARTASTIGLGNCGATMIVTACSSYGGTITGSWIVEISSRGDKPTMTVRTLLKENGVTVNFGYYILDNYFYFGVYTNTYRAQGVVTILRNTNVTIQDFGDVSVAPTGWTIVPSVPVGLKETYNSGYNFYRIYNDNWIEQGGTFDANTGNWASTSLTFLKPFRDNYYHLHLQGNWSDPQSSSCEVTARTTSGATVTHANNQYSIYPSIWYACGFI